MNFVKYITDLSVLMQSNEKLLRLLHYMPQSPGDDILQISETYPALTPHLKDDGTLDESIPYVGDEMYEAISDDLVIPRNQYDDLKTLSKNRLCIYLSDRRSIIGQNSRVQFQQFYCDVWVHKTYEACDFRMEKICDFLSDELFGKRITGIGKVDEVLGRDIKLTPASQYFCYEMVYEFRSAK